MLPLPMNYQLSISCPVNPAPARRGWGSGVNFPLLIVSLLLLSACRPVPLAEIAIPFTGESVLDEIEGETYRYFRYTSVEEAQADISKVSKDGKEIAGKRMRWEGPVHIYYTLKRIVVYVGSNPKVIAPIKQVFGPQVAGDPIEAKPL